MAPPTPKPPPLTALRPDHDDDEQRAGSDALHRALVKSDARVIAVRAGRSHRTVVPRNDPALHVQWVCDEIKLRNAHATGSALESVAAAAAAARRAEEEELGQFDYQVDQSVKLRNDIDQLGHQLARRAARRHRKSAVSNVPVFQSRRARRLSTIGTVAAAAATVAASAGSPADESPQGRLGRRLSTSSSIVARPSIKVDPTHSSTHPHYHPQPLPHKGGVAPADQALKANMSDGQGQGQSHSHGHGHSNGKHEHTALPVRGTASKDTSLIPVVAAAMMGTAAATAATDVATAGTATVGATAGATAASMAANSQASVVGAGSSAVTSSSSFSASSSSLLPGAHVPPSSSVELSASLAADRNSEEQLTLTPRAPRGKRRTRQRGGAHSSARKLKKIPAYVLYQSHRPMAISEIPSMFEVGKTAASGPTSIAGHDGTGTSQADELRSPSSATVGNGKGMPFSSLSDHPPATRQYNPAQLLRHSPMKTLRQRDVGLASYMTRRRSQDQPSWKRGRHTGRRSSASARRRSGAEPGGGGQRGAVGIAGGAATTGDNGGGVPGGDDGGDGGGGGDGDGGGDSSGDTGGGGGNRNRNLAAAAAMYGLGGLDPRVDAGRQLRRTCADFREAQRQARTDLCAALRENDHERSNNFNFKFKALDLRQRGPGSITECGMGGSATHIAESLDLRARETKLAQQIDNCRRSSFLDKILHAAMEIGGGGAGGTVASGGVASGMGIGEHASPGRVRFVGALQQLGQQGIAVDEALFKELLLHAVSPDDHLFPDLQKLVAVMRDEVLKLPPEPYAVWLQAHGLHVPSAVQETIKVRARRARREQGESSAGGLYATLAIGRLRRKVRRSRARAKDGGAEG